MSEKFFQAYNPVKGEIQPLKGNFEKNYYQTARRDLVPVSTEIPELIAPRQK